MGTFSIINGVKWMLLHCAFKTAYACNEQLTADVGTFTSPNYPSDYGNYENCAWSINVNQSSNVHLIVVVVNIETESTCSYDALKIYDGDGAVSPLLATICSSAQTVSFVSTGHQMYVTFTSDLSITGQGFHASYSTTGYVEEETQTEAVTTTLEVVTTVAEGVTTTVDITTTVTTAEKTTTEQTTTQAATTTAPIPTTTDIPSTAGPSIECNIECVSQCDPEARISHDNTFIATCEYDDGRDFVNYIWRLQNSETVQLLHENVETVPQSGSHTIMLEIPRNSLAPGLGYTLTLMFGEEDLSFAFDFYSSAPPSGDCRVDPPAGNALAVEFTISCEVAEVSHPPLLYTYGAYPKEESFSHTVKHSSSNGTTGLLDLPLGNPDMNYLTVITVTIQDSLGDFTETTLEITVEPNILTAEETAALLDDALSDLSDPDVLQGNSELLMQTSNILTSMGTPNDTAAQEKVLAIKRALVGTLDRELNSTDDLTQQAAVLGAVLSGGSLPADMQNQVASAMESTANSFASLSNNLDSEEKLNLGQGIATQSVSLLSSSSSVSSTSSSSSNATESEVDQDQAKQMSNKIIAVLDTVLSAVTEPGSDTTINAGSSTLYGSNQNMEELQGKTISNMNVGVTIPQSENSASNDTLFIQAMISEFLRKWEGCGVDSDVVRFTCDDCANSEGNSKRKRRSTNEAGLSHINLEMNTNNEQSPYEVLVDTLMPGEMVYHYMNLSMPYKPIIVSLYTAANFTLDVYVAFERDGLNITSDIQYFQVTPSFSGNGNNSAIIDVTSMDINNATELHIGVMDADCTEDSNCTEVRNFTYSYTMAELVCSYYDEEMDDWVHGGCSGPYFELSEDSTPKQIKFKSSLLGSIGASVFVGPNTIDFSTVFNNFGAKIIENIAVFITVIGFILLYFPLLVISRKLDQRDKFKWSVQPLTDDIENDKHEYEIHVYTGSKRNAGTTSSIKFIIAGTDGDTGERSLSDGVRKNFQAGDVNSFRMKCPHSLGTPLFLRIWLDNIEFADKNDSSWFLSKIIIIDVKSEEWYLYQCNKWLSYNRDDCCTSRVLHMATAEDLATGRTLLMHNLKKMFYSDHIWLSVAHQKMRNRFTRVQRLSCCLATLLLTMVASAMWYGTENKDEGQKSAITFGVISITVHQIYTSLMSCGTVAIPILVLIVLFEKLDYSKSEKKQGGSVLFLAKKRKFKLPYGFIFLAYLLVFLCVAGGAFFTILYAFQWGKAKSEEWLGCLMLSVCQSIIVVQPVKVVLVIVIYSFWFKSDSDTIDFESNVGKLKFRDKALKPLNSTLISSEDQYIPLEKTKEIERKKDLDKRMINLFYEIFWDVVFTALVLWIVMGNQNGNVFLQNRNIDNLVIPQIHKISNDAKAWAWIRDDLLSLLYPTLDYNGNQLDDTSMGYLSDQSNFRFGTPRLRQLRLLPGKCKIVKDFQGIVNLCSKNYDEPLLDARNYDSSWLLLKNDSQIHSNHSKIERAFLHSEADMSVYFLGRLHWYPRSGYIAELGINMDESISIIDSLQEKYWIDEYTRVVFVEFGTLNANTNLFSFVTISLEFLITGDVVYKKDIQSIQLYRYIGGIGLLNICAEILTLIFAIVVTIQEVVQFIKEKRKYFKNFSNVITVITLVMFYAAVLLYVWKSLLTMKTVEDVKNKAGSMDNFNKLTWVYTYFIFLMGFAAFFLIIRMLYILRYVKSITTLATTLIKSGYKLISVGIIFLIVFFGTTCYVFLSYSTLVAEYSSYIQTCSTILSLSFKGFEKFVADTGSLGILVIIFYAMVIIYIFTNMFVAILEDYLQSLKQNKEIHKNSEVIDYILELFKEVFQREEAGSIKFKNANRIYPYYIPGEQNGELLEERIKTLLQFAINNIEYKTDSGQALEDFLLDYYDWLDHDVIKTS